MSPTKIRDNPLTQKVTAEVYCRTVTTVLNETYGSVRGATKIIARSIESTSETVRDWFLGRTAPRGAELIRLMAECPALESAVISLVRSSRQSSLDADTRAFRHLSPIEREQRLRNDMANMKERVDALDQRMRALDAAETQSADPKTFTVDRRGASSGSRAHPTGERRIRA